MTDQRWSQFKELLHAALQLAPDQRDRYLEEACGPDLALRRESNRCSSPDARIAPSLLRSSLGEVSRLHRSGHPAIAKVFDAGATPQGQPYFVMEYVP